MGGSDDELDKIDEKISKARAQIRKLKHQKKMLIRKREKDKKEEGIEKFRRTNKRGSK